MTEGGDHRAEQEHRSVPDGLLGFATWVIDNWWRTLRVMCLVPCLSLCVALLLATPVAAAVGVGLAVAYVSGGALPPVAAGAFAGLAMLASLTGFGAAVWKARRSAATPDAVPEGTQEG